MASNDIRKGNGYGFKRDDGGIAMIRCFNCGYENYAMAVMSGQCCWCGHDANTQESERQGEGNA